MKNSNFSNILSNFQLFSRNVDLHLVMYAQRKFRLLNVSQDYKCTSNFDFESYLYRKDTAVYSH